MLLVVPVRLGDRRRQARSGKHRGESLDRCQSPGSRYFDPPPAANSCNERAHGTDPVILKVVGCYLPPRVVPFFPGRSGRYALGRRSSQGTKCHKEKYQSRPDSRKKKCAGKEIDSSSSKGREGAGKLTSSSNSHNDPTRIIIDLSDVPSEALEIPNVTHKKEEVSPR